MLLPGGRSQVIEKVVGPTELESVTSTVSRYRTPCLTGLGAENKGHIVSAFVHNLCIGIDSVHVLCTTQCPW